jgi:tetratricopeptide (TPR) repeat protein
MAIAYWGHPPYSFANMRLMVFLVMLVSAPAVANEPSKPVEAGVHRFVAKYVNAWQSMNPFRLMDLAAPGLTTFNPLLIQERFDRLQKTAVTVHNIRVVSTSDSGNRVVVSFIKDHEDLFRDGTLTRGIGRVSVTLRAQKPHYSPRAGIDYHIVKHKLEALESPVGSGSEKIGISESQRHFRTAVLQVGQRRFHRALVSLDKALAVADGLELKLGADRFKAQVHYYRAVCLKQKGELTETIAGLENALRFNREFPLALNALARSRAGVGDLAGAVERYRQSLDLYRDQPVIQTELEFYRLALTAINDPTQRTAYLALRGMTPHRALERVRKQMKAHPSNPVWFTVGATLLLETHRPLEAEALLKKTPGDKSAPLNRYLMAQAALARGDQATALKRFDSLWNLAPGYRDTIVYITELSDRARRWRTAIAYLKEALLTDPGSPTVLYKIGLFELRMGRRFRALRALQQARENRPPKRIRIALHRLFQQF